MWYALVNFSNDCGGTLGLICGGTLRAVADELQSQCSISLQEARELEGLSYEEIEEAYAADLDDYLSLLEGDAPSAEGLAAFTFTFSDASVSVVSLVSSYPALVEAFNTYAEESFWLDDWRMLPDSIDALDTLSEVDSEMRSLADGLQEFQYFQRVRKE